MQFKKIIFLVLSTIFLFSGCTTSNINKIDDDKINITTTSYSVYDWVSNIVLGLDNYNVYQLQNSSIDLHNYQPTVSDITQIYESDIFIYIGVESDEWILDVIEQNPNPDLITINLFEVLKDDLVEVEIKKGMEHDDHNEHNEYDEHVWLSIKNAITSTSFISNIISDNDPINKIIIDTNTKNYISKLNTLDESYAKVIDNSINNTLIFGDRFAFRYLTEDYNLDYYAAFEGCSAESEASFDTIIYLAQKIDENNLNYILVLEDSDQQIANSIIRNTANLEVEILTLNSLQTTSNSDLSYIDIMNDNLNIISQALN